MEQAPLVQEIELSARWLDKLIVVDAKAIPPIHKSRICSQEQHTIDDVGNLDTASFVYRDQHRCGCPCHHGYDGPILASPFLVRALEPLGALKPEYDYAREQDQELYPNWPHALSPKWRLSHHQTAFYATLANFPAPIFPADLWMAGAYYES
jgi:hypothetical protein